MNYVKIGLIILKVLGAIAFIWIIMKLAKQGGRGIDDVDYSPKRIKVAKPKKIKK